MDFKIKLAGITAFVSVMYDSTKELCRDYITDEQASLEFAVTTEDIEYERMKSAREDEIEGRAVRDFSDKYLETLALYRKFAEVLPQYGIALFHGSAIAVDGVGYLFAAKSGTGKSTHTRLWREAFGERAIMINDDKPLLKVTDEGVFVYGTPWDGKHKLSTNASVPLKSICVLTRAKNNEIKRITYSQAYIDLFQQTYRPANRASMLKTLDLIDIIGKKCELYRLGCNMDISAAHVAYEGMNK